MPDHPYRKALNAMFIPMLRSEGFKGSGTTFRRHKPPVTHVFNIQGSVAGKQCYFNMGVHLNFLPVSVFDPKTRIVESKLVPAEELHHSNCVFTTRLRPPTGNGWVYLATEKEIKESIEVLIGQWNERARVFFDRYRYPEYFAAKLDTMEPSEFRTSEDLWMYANIAKQLGYDEKLSALVKDGSIRFPNMKQSFEQLVSTPTELEAAI